MSFSTADERFMRLAIRLSLLGLGYTEPNPMVGAVVVKDGHILTTGYHSCFGKAHAEREALSNKDIPPGSTLYVTLEPCTHYGKTPPCLDIVLEKRLARVVIASIDPNPLVNGKGVRSLREAGIEVETGCLQSEADWVNRHYRTFMINRRPHITLKAGMSADGKMSDEKKNSCWVTSAQLRQLANGLRGEFAAVLVGSGTIIADDPLLTIRPKPWPGKRLARIVLDSKGQLSGKQRIFNSASAEQPVIWVTGKGCILNDIENPNISHLPIALNETGWIDLNALLTGLHDLAITSVLVEGGAAVMDSFLAAGLVDELILFVAPTLIGGLSSLTPFASGRPIDKPIHINNPTLIQLDSGWILRGVP